MGVTVGPDGLLYVADTHYQRVLVYDKEGRSVRSFGEFGTGPGQFDTQPDRRGLGGRRADIREASTAATTASAPRPNGGSLRCSESRGTATGNSRGLLGFGC